MRVVVLHSRKKERREEGERKRAGMRGGRKWGGGEEWEGKERKEGTGGQLALEGRHGADME